MSVRHLLSLANLGRSELIDMVERSLAIKRGEVGAPLRDKIVGLLFEKTSTRTRTAFTTGAIRLGGAVVSYGPDDLQTNTGETLDDTGRVLCQALDALVVRSAGAMADLRRLANQDRMAVVNAMTACEHPTQALADLATMAEHFGTLRGLRVVYIGDGNNTAAALALAISQLPAMRLSLITPAGYGLPAACLQRVALQCDESGAVVVQLHDVRQAPSGADIIYGTRWKTTGVAKPDADWRRSFEGFGITAELFHRIGGPAAVFMHDLPAVRGEDVAGDLLDGPQSIAFTQAGNKVFGAMAVLEWCLCHAPAGRSRLEPRLAHNVP